MYQIQGDTIILRNGESYTFHELQFLRWELDGWKRLARVTQLKLENTGKKEAALFELDELAQIRDALRLLDDKLPGYKLRDKIKDDLPRRLRRR